MAQTIPKYLVYFIIFFIPISNNIQFLKQANANEIMSQIERIKAEAHQLIDAFT